MKSIGLVAGDWGCHYLPGSRIGRRGSCFFRLQVWKLDLDLRLTLLKNLCTLVSIIILNIGFIRMLAPLIGPSPGGSAMRK